MFWCTCTARAWHERGPQQDSLLVGYGFRDGTWPDAPDPRLLGWAPPGLGLALLSNDLHAA